jgi:8-oxo-dGTP pyrophosphatase MutT (NUDIX family)
MNSTISHHASNKFQFRNPNSRKDFACNNCGKLGHFYQQCKIPIISFGIISYKVDPEDGKIKFLMIRRAHTLGFVDFMRGKYSIYNREYLLNLFQEMTLHEKELLNTHRFSDVWNKMWNKPNIKSDCGEYTTSNEKFNLLKSGIINQSGEQYSLEDLIRDSNAVVYDEQEWGFPKGRREQNETDYDCAIREFTEETGYSSRQLTPIENIVPFEEIFMGSNMRSYKHKYYLMRHNPVGKNESNPDPFEVSKMEWKTFEECVACIRPYNLEKIRIIENVYKILCGDEYKIM